MCNFRFQYAFKVIVFICLVLNWLNVAKANVQDPLDEVFISIKTADNTLLEIFEAVKTQTAYSFAYDDNAVNVSQKISIRPGQITLSNLLDEISQKAGLRFTQKNFSIIVSSTSVTT